MPKRFLTYSRTEPARTILWVVSLLTALAQVAAVLIGGWFYGPTGLLLSLPNSLLVVGVAGWAIWACQKNDLKHMSRAAFVQFIFWLWSGLTRAFLSPDASQLLWVPFLVVAMVMSIVYLYLSNQKRNGGIG